VFAHEVRARYAEVDAQGVVFNAHYLTWVDDAMSAWLEAVGYRGASWDAAPAGGGGGQAADEVGWDLMVRHASLDWRGSARFGDRVRIACSVRRWGTTSFDVVYQLSCGGRDLVEVVITYVGIRNAPDGTWSTAPVPARLRHLLAADGPPGDSADGSDADVPRGGG
jgi:acyl-CoA thioester hydrolase